MKQHETWVCRDRSSGIHLAGRREESTLDSPLQSQGHPCGAARTVRQGI
jgi:hypothetical protein